MSPFYDACFDDLMVREGGDQYVNRPDDLGGPTKYGVSLRFYRRLKNDPTVPSDVIKNLSRDEAKEIARAEFWIPLNLDLATDQRVANAIFDQSFPLGVPKCAGIVQSSIKEMCPYIVVDNHLGPICWECLNRGPTSMFLAYFKSNLNIYYEAVVKINPTQRGNLQGWLNRASKITNIA